MRKILNILFLVSFFYTPFLLNGSELYKPPQKERIGKRLQYAMEKMSDTDELNIWVFFTDKGIFTKDEYNKRIAQFKNNLSPRRRRRREKTGKIEIVDFTDLPVNRDYVKRIEEEGAEKRVVSNWLNGASFRVKKSEIETLKDLPFIRKVERVEKFYSQPLKYKPVEKIMKKMDKEEEYEFNYGNSKAQNSVIAVDIAHNNGYFGKGIRIGLFDTGFYLDSTRFEALGVVSKNIIDTWNFIHDTSYVGPEYGDPPGQINHGTSMLSLIAGFKDNELIGPAFNAEFALAKTEQIDREIKQEEDRWAAAAEWADSCGPDKGGVDIISSSLGYKTFNDTIGYSYTDMNGNSAKITIAADLAVSKGIVVVTAMGNVDYKNPTDRPDTCIVAPADGDSVISVGAVDSNYVSGKWEWAWLPEAETGAIIGPTSDGRRKPEVCATWCGHHTNPEYDPEQPDTAQKSPYVTGQGTSVSTAMLAGGCALILQAHPDWSPMKLKDVLCKTASQSGTPDDTLGWGIANIWEAINYEKPEIPSFEKDELSPPYPNPFVPKKHSRVVIPFNIMNQGLGGTIFIYSLSGKKIREIDLGSFLLPGRYTTPEEGAVIWDGKESNGNIVDSGIYIILLRTGYASSTQKLAVVR